VTRVGAVMPVSPLFDSAFLTIPNLTGHNQAPVNSRPGTNNRHFQGAWTPGPTATGSARSILSAGIIFRQAVGSTTRVAYRGSPTVQMTAHGSAHSAVHRRVPGWNAVQANQKAT
jgi:hypothetical protein